MELAQDVAGGFAGPGAGGIGFSIRWARGLRSGAISSHSRVGGGGHRLSGSPNWRTVQKTLGVRLTHAISAADL